MADLNTCYKRLLRLLAHSLSLLISICWRRYYSLLIKPYIAVAYKLLESRESCRLLILGRCLQQLAVLCQAAALAKGY